MKSIVQHASPNIIAGVNFNTDRFSELFAWMTTLAADSVQALLQPYQYGLVLPFDGKRALNLNKTGNKLTLSRCSAITQGGAIIGIFEGITPILETTISAQLQVAHSYYVVIEVDAFHRKTFGPNTSDAPERPQYSMPTYQLNIRPVEEDLGRYSNVLRIGVLAFENGEWALQNYIPPCLHIGASEILMQQYEQYQAALKQLLDYLPKVIQQTETFDNLSNKQLREFCTQIGSFLAQRASNYYNLSEYGNPYQLFQLWSGFAGLGDFLLERLNIQSKRSFYQLLAQNDGIGVNFQPDQLEQRLNELAQLSFKQYHIHLAVQKTNTVLNQIMPLFRRLSIHIKNAGKSWGGDNGIQNPSNNTENSPKPENKNRGYIGIGGF